MAYSHVTLSVMAKALIMGRSIVSAAKEAQAKVAPWSAAAAANSSTDLACRTDADGERSTVGAARKSAMRAGDLRWEARYHAFMHILCTRPVKTGACLFRFHKYYKGTCMMRLERSAKVGACSVRL